MNTTKSISEKCGLSPVIIFLLGMPVFALNSMDEAQAAPTFQAAGTAVGGTGNLTTLAWPAHAVDDIALLFVESAGGEPVALSNNTAGFVAVANSPQATGAGTAGTRISVFWARATSTSMTAPRVDDPGNHAYAQIITYRGVINTGNPWDVTGGGVKAAASTSVTVTGVTTTVPDTLIVQAVARDNDSANAAFSNETNSNLTGIAERSDAGTASNNGGGFAVWDGVKATAGATGNTTATVTSSINAFLTIALKPAPPSVSSISRASTDPTEPGLSVSWTVIFSTSVTGVDATDFSLVQAGGVSGASITSVTGSGTTWTVTANTGTGTGSLGLNLVDDDSIVDAGGNKLGGTGAGNGNFTGEVYTVSPPFCTPPSNIPAGVTVSCVCDTFGRASLNPSTIYGSNWIVSTSDGTGIVPSIVNPGYLRLTDRTANNAKAATVPGIFPAAGNYISVEFLHYAYDSANSGNIGNCASNTGADGIAVTLSDYSVTAVPGAFGGSLGYAQHTNPSNVVGFAGGWVGIALDEWGNFQNPTEGRNGGPGPRCESIGVRGSGSGMTGYPWVGGSATLPTRIDDYTSGGASPGYYYQVIVDARNAGNPTPQTFVSVLRDTSGTGTAYSTLVSPFDVFAANPGQAAVPSNWQISFTGSTGGSNNIHEIGGLRICAQTVAPPSGGTASGFNAIDEAYGTPPSGPAVQSFLNGHLYMKVMGLPFKLNVAALNNNQIVTTYAAGGNKNVAVKLVDNSDGVCILDSTQANYCNAACTGKTAVAGGSQTLTFVAGDSGKKQSANFTLNTAYKNLAAIMSDGTTTACSTDAFSVRPASIDSVTSSPALIAAGAAFSLTATTTGIPGNPSGYTGVLKINTSAMQVPSGAVVGSLAPTTFPAATSGTPSSTATGNTFTYSEVGTFNFLGYPTTNTTSPRGVYDGVAAATECAAPVTPAQCDILRAATWMGIDSVTSKGDCVQNNYSNTKDANGKYGCSFGIVANTGAIGRFTPAYFDVTKIDGCTGGGAFTYSGQPFSQVQVKAKAVGGTDTKNYDGVTLGFAKAVDLSDGNGATAGSFGNGTFAAAGFANGAQAKTNVTYTFTATNNETPSLTLKLRATEALGGDGVSSNYAGATEDNAKILSGRINVYNAYGSELVDLYVPMQAEYYEDTTVTLPATNPPITGWIANTADTCSAVKLKALTNFQGNLTAAMTCVQDTGSPGVSNQGCASAGPASEQYRTLPKVSGLPPPPLGSYNLYLQKPTGGNTGSADVSADLSTQPWLRFDWTGAGNVDPVGRVSFGLYRGSPRHIYLRER